MNITPNLATCSYKALTPEMGVGVSTSVGKPRGWQGSKVQGIPHRPYIAGIAPYNIFGHKPAYDEPTFRHLYDLRLQEKAVDIDRDIERLSAQHPGERLVMLCWCTVTHRDDYCHRLMWSRFAESRYQVEIPELAIAEPSLSELDFQAFARQRKVDKLTRAAHDLGLGAADLVMPAVRDLLVARSGVNPPSDTTWQLVLAALA